MPRKTHTAIFVRDLFYYGLLFVAALTVTFCGQNNTAGPTVVQASDIATLVVSGVPDFGSVLLNESSNRTFTITNIGKAAATQITGTFYLSVAFSYTGGTFPGTGGNCTDVLHIGKSCTVEITFSPKYMGSSQSALDISYHNGVGRVSTKDPLLKGSGV